MSTRAAPSFSPPRDVAQWVLLGAGGVTAAVAGVLIARPSGLRLALVVGSLVLMVGVSLVLPKYLLYGLMIWLAGLGLVRRLVSVPGHSSRLDPLLLVAPIALGVLFLVAARGGGFRAATPLSKAVGVLTILAAAGALNPLQGSFASGSSGLLFMVVPTLAFWVGRGLCSDQTLSRLLKLIALLAVGGAAYGLMQTFSHFPAWDQAWIRSAGYRALNVGGVTRAFGTFSSAQEYALFLSIGIGVWLGLGLKGIRGPVVAAAVGMLGIAVFYESSRSVVVYLVLALGIVAAVRIRLPWAVAGVVGLACLGGLLLAASRFGSANFGTGPTSALVAHQVHGLADPLNPSSSTLIGHLSIAGQGLHSVLVYPLGVGTGAVSIAAGKFGGLSAGTELDPSNLAVALGLPGLLAYLAVFVLGLTSAYRLALLRRDRLSRVALCVLIITLFQWLNGGLYSVAFLPWLILGWVDRAGPGAPQEAVRE